MDSGQMLNKRTPVLKAPDRKKCRGGGTAKVLAVPLGRIVRLARQPRDLAVVILLKAEHERETAGVRKDLQVQSAEGKGVTTSMPSSACRLVPCIGSDGRYPPYSHERKYRAVL